MNYLVLSLLWAGYKNAALPTYPSAVAPPGTLVNTEDTYILTLTIEADLEEEENTANISELLQPMHTGHLCI